MTIVNHPFLVSIVAAAVFALNSPLLAAEPADVTKLYDEFNAQLQRAGPRNPDALRSFYSKALNKTTDECNSASGCRSSDRIFLDVITLIKYEITSIESRSDGSVNLTVSGSNASGAKMGLIVKWLFEEERWRIDSITKVPPNWDQLKRKLRGEPAAPN